MLCKLALGNDREDKFACTDVLNNDVINNDVSTYEISLTASESLRHYQDQTNSIFHRPGQLKIVKDTNYTVQAKHTYTNLII